MAQISNGPNGARVVKTLKDRLYVITDVIIVVNNDDQPH